VLQATLFFGWFALIALVAVGWRSVRRREIAWQRLAEVNQTRAEGEPVRVGVRRLHRRWIWAPWGLALIVAAVTALVSRFSMPYVVALGVMVGFLASQLESFLAARHAATLEGQLADAIDIMIGAVDAGAGVGAAIDAAITECRAPLRPYLEEVKGRIQLGDEPAEVFRSLAQRVPLEAFLLFTSALAVHWEVGGKLSSTLTTVGRTIRDRIDVARRIRSNTAQSQFSTLAIIGLTYFIAVIVWRNGPEQMEEFVRSSVGSWFVAGSVVLQAVGIVWMNLISKPRF
jgi:Flp pilus assembly protein TadB